MIIEDHDFQNLVTRCLETHQTLRKRASKAVDLALVARNWLFGRHIVEFEQKGDHRADYGSRLIPQLSEKLTQELGKGFSTRALELSRKFYQSYPGISQTPSAKSPEEVLLEDPEAISQSLSAKFTTEQAPAIWQVLADRFSLSWSHYVALLGIKDEQERSFYEIEAREGQWSLRELKRQMNSGLYERLALSRDQDGVRQLAEKGQLVETPADLIKSPYILEFLGLDEKSAYSESDLETAIIDKLEHFLLELGKGFLFEARQKRFTFDEDHYFVDLVFYNRLLRCYTLIDLKIGEIAHQDLGQMQMYVNYFDRHVKTPDEAPTIGIVLCKRKKDALVEITLPQDSNIHASEYQLYLPSKEELKAQLESVKLPIAEKEERE